MNAHRFAAGFLAILLLPPQLLFAGDTPGEIRVAAASNFKATLVEISRAFEIRTGYAVSLAFGSSGKQYAQLRSGAPFDAFFSADSARPEKLERAGVAVPGSRFTYAIGRLVLWSPRAGRCAEGRDGLQRGNFRHLAIANPDLAPYGVAAREALQALGLWKGLQDRLVRGENISQAYQFVYSGNAELGLIARSQLARGADGSRAICWLVPARLHAPIVQQAVLLENGPAARDFMNFVRGPEARSIIRRRGYDLPGIVN